MLNEMAIPRSGGDIILNRVISTVVAFFVILGVFNLFNRVAMIPSGTWLVLVTWWAGSAIRREGSLRSCLTNLVGALAGRQFVEITPQDLQPQEIRFGFRLFGHRFIQHRKTLDKLRSVSWAAGQATSRMGRDMNDWHVCLWFDQDEQPPSQRRRKRPRSDQYIWIVGPSRREDETEAFGQSFVAFLRDAGASLDQDEKGMGSRCPQDR